MTFSLESAVIIVESTRYVSV